jgi:hypothetical protein
MQLLYGATTVKPPRNYAFSPAAIGFEPNGEI